MKYRIYTGTIDSSIALANRLTHDINDALSRHNLHCTVTYIDEKE
jgi:hypothetical protein